MMKLHRQVIQNGLLALASLFATLAIVLGVTYFYLSSQLPNIDTLKNVQLQVPLRIYKDDDKLMGEYGEMRRIPVTLDQIPKPLINAVLATEDQRYFEHPGVDFLGLLRAAKALVVTGKKTQGASTITMQVARNFFLTRKKTYARKINEILLAIKIDHEFSKQKILELYLNKIYLGQRSYGIAAAAQTYYGKTLNELTFPEMAMIAGLPQAPSRDNPITNPDAALKRRNHVIERMLERGYINETTAKEAMNTPSTASYHGQHITVKAPYIAEMARAATVEKYGDAVYTEGFNVYTTIQSNLQQAANQAFRAGLLAYDQRHGYRGPEANWGQPDINNANFISWQRALEKIPSYNGLIPAAVLAVKNQSVIALLKNGKIITIPWSGLVWARAATNGRWTGPTPTNAAQVARVGNVIRVQLNKNSQWQLAQLPKAEAALVALNPENGKVLAMVGGFDYQYSNFNRVTQSYRQPGSSFKPFIYSAALAKGFTLATLINDAPIVMEDSGENELWRPQNDTTQFYGPTRLRTGLTESRNLVSIRLLQSIGIPYALHYVYKFGFNPDQMPNSLSLALGTGGVTPIELAVGYAAFANGGYHVEPNFINYISDGDNHILFKASPITAPPDTNNQQLLATNHGVATNIVTQENNSAEKNQPATRIISPEIAYLMNNALESVIQTGTGHAARVLNRSDLAGKTGTTNNQVDAWFSGYGGDIVATVWVGFDQPESLYEYGAQAALPMWIDFMRIALKDRPEHVLKQPTNIVTVRIDPKTGLLAYPGQKNAIFEVFCQDLVPTKRAPNPGNQQENSDNDTNEPLF